MAWTSLNEEASGYYQCLSVHQAGTGVSHPNGQVYRAGVQQRHYRGWIRFKDLLWLPVSWYPSLPSGSWFFWLVSPVCGVMPGNGRSAWPVTPTGSIMLLLQVCITASHASAPCWQRVVIRIKLSAGYCVLCPAIWAISGSWLHGSWACLRFWCRAWVSVRLPVMNNAVQRPCMRLPHGL